MDLNLRKHGNAAKAIHQYMDVVWELHVSAVSILVFGKNLKQIFSISLQYNYGCNTDNYCFNIRGISEQKYTKDADMADQRRRS